MTSPYRILHSMNTNRILLILVSAITSLGLVSCASTGNPSVAAAKHTFHSRKTYTQGIVGGAIIGALAGAASGLQIGPGGIGFDEERAKRGAVVGAGVGAVGGGLYAHHKVQERRAYAAQAGALEGAIKQTQSTREAAAAFNQTLSKELSSMKRGDAAVVGTISDAKSVLASIDREIASERGRLNAQMGTPEERSRLSRQIASLESEKSELVGLINRLNSKNTTGRLATQ
jgi:hypothetical protein